jgi:putative transposase
MESGFCGLRVLTDLLTFLTLGLRSRTALAAENLFLRKQLAFYQERRVRPRRLDQATRLALVWLSRWFTWRDALSVVTPRTFIGWHRRGFQFFWRRKSRCGRPRIPTELRQLIRRLAAENPTWGEERIDNELLLKLGLRVSPRTIGSTYLSRQFRLTTSPGAINAGQPFSGITRTPLSPATSVSLSPRPSGCSTCS